jgi:hypothetical protein
MVRSADVGCTVCGAVPRHSGHETFGLKLIGDLMMACVSAIAHCPNIKQLITNASQIGRLPQYKCATTCCARRTDNGIVQ